MRVSLGSAWVVVFCGLGSVGVARAGDCALGDAPSAYASAPCDGGSPADWCTRTGGVVTCDMEGSGSSPITVYGVSAYSKGGADFALYGTDDAGNGFCCAFRETSAEIARVRVWGDPDTADTLWLQSADSSSWIQDPGGAQALLLDVKGAGGADDIRGTKSTQALIVETLHGNEGDDTLHAYRASLVYGDEDQDTVYGSADDDLLFGDAGCGGLEGVEDDDQVFAGSGDDEVKLCKGRDLACGDGGDDTIFGDADGDTLWGGSPYGESNTIDGGSSTLDHCGAGTLTSCEYVIGAPDEC